MLRANGNEVSLTRSEFHLADALLREPGAVLSVPQLVAAIWVDRPPPDEVGKALRTHVYTLRGKLAQVAPDAGIENFPRRGYALQLSSSEPARE